MTRWGDDPSMRIVIFAGALWCLVGCGNTASDGNPSACSCPVGYTVLSCSGGKSECLSPEAGEAMDAGTDVQGGSIADARRPADARDEAPADGSSGDGDAMQGDGGACGDINENCCWGNACNSAGLWCVYSAYYGVPRCVDSATATGARLSACGQPGDQCCPTSEGSNCSGSYYCYVWQVPDGGYPTTSSQCEPSSGCTLAAANESLPSICSTYYGSPTSGAAFDCYGGSAPTGSSCRQIDEGAGLGATPGPESWCCQSHPACAVDSQVLTDCAGSGSEQMCTFGAVPGSSANCVASTYSPSYATATLTDFCCN